MSDALHERIQKAILGSKPGMGRFWEWPDAAFEMFTRALFLHQYDNCVPYRRFCDARGVTPESLRSWDQVPAVPTDVFKSIDLCTFPPEQAAVTFETSGTTQGKRGRHHLRRTDTYEASLAPWLEGFLLSDGTRPRVIVLAPPRAADPASSLSFMLQWAVDQRGPTGSRFAWTDTGPDIPGVVAELRRSSVSEVPLLLMGTARALELLLQEGLDGTMLPPLANGSRVMETGGFKGAEQKMGGADLRAALATALGLNEEAVVSEYGMTELGSQGYHPTLRASLDWRTDRRFERFDDPRLFVFPPWCRVRATDPETLEALPLGERGLLCFWDLSNVDSILAVQTADEGVVLPEGVRLFGRAPGSTPRGCSLAIDEILSAAPAVR